MTGTRKLGNTELQISPVAFGAWAIGGWMWGGSDRKDAIEAIKRSVEKGMTTIDTAPVYGFGLSEEIVGEAVSGVRDKVQILTKYGLNWNTLRGEFFFASRHNNGKPVNIHRYADKRQVIRECEASLKRMKIDYIDLYQIHWPDPTTPVEETMQAIIRLKEKGKIREAGVCNYDLSLMKEAAEMVNLASNQVPYSMVRREIEKEVAPWCMENNVGILAYSPLQRGLLTGKIKPDYLFSEGDSRPSTPHFSLANIIRTNSFLDQIRPMAEEKGISLSQLVIRWTIQQPGITAALVGARNPEQVEDNAGALLFELSDGDIRQINSFLADLNLDLDA
ncbi:MAG: aldo/keto reductase [Bacteroidota bacterium]